jgi:hypothetical protein
MSHKRYFVTREEYDEYGPKVHRVCATLLLAPLRRLRNGCADEAARWRRMAANKNR